MMFELKICSKTDAQSFGSFWATQVISLLDPGFERNWESIGKNNLVMAFHDVESLISDWIRPEMHDLEKILEFSKNFKETDKILIHCHQGISRSTAVAIAVLIQHGKSYQEAFAIVEKIRPILWPNRQIAKLTDDYFNLKGEYHHFLVEYKRKNVGNFALPQIDKEVSKVDVDFMKKLKNLF